MPVLPVLKLVIDFHSLTCVLHAMKCETREFSFFVADMPQSVPLCEQQPNTRYPFPQKKKKLIEEKAFKEKNKYKDAKEKDEKEMDDFIEKQLEK